MEVALSLSYGGSCSWHAVPPSFSDDILVFVRCIFYIHQRKHAGWVCVWGSQRLSKSIFNFVCTLVCRSVGTCMPLCLWRSEHNLKVLTLSFETGSSVCYGMCQPSWPGSFQASPILPQSAGVADTRYHVQFYMGTSNPGPYPCAASVSPLSHLPVLFFPHRYLTSWLDTGGNNFFFGMLKIHLFCPSAALKNSEPLYRAFPGPF